MADLGSKTNLNADVDAKVTTNGANENTGARVNDCLNNIVDTLYGQGGVHKGDYQAGLVVNYRDTVTHLNQIWAWQSTETTTTDWATDSGNFGIPIGASPAYLPKVYTFTGTGNGTSGDVGVNTYGVDITVTNAAIGRYEFAPASGTPFTTGGKTTVSITIIDNSQALGVVMRELSDVLVKFEVFDTATQSMTDPAQYQVTITTEP